MLKVFEVSNYKNFKEKIVIDFENISGYQFNNDCVINNHIGKMLIYGRNSTGKTNLGRALMDLRNTLIMPYSYYSDFENNYFLNSNSTCEYADFRYTFEFDNKIVIYEYRKTSSSKLYDETLSIDNSIIFQCNYVTRYFSFDGLSHISVESIVTDRFLDANVYNEELEENEERNISFLKWIIGNSALGPDSILLKIDEYARRMIMFTAGNSIRLATPRLYLNFYEKLQNPDELNALEDFLNLMGLNCKLAIEQLPDGQFELYFNQGKLIPFNRTASSGTIALLNLYRMFHSSKSASLFYLDEFDAFYHYEMADLLVKYFKANFPKSQVILTSHNTNLMTNRLFRPDCLFILSRDGILTPIGNATERELREGHNLEKMYISGEFEQYE